LNDPGKFKAPFIPKERIWQETEKLRAAHPAGRAMPVQVLELAEPGEPCRKCSTPVIKQTSRKKPKHDFYYKYYLWCPKCQTTYTVEAAKRLVEQPPSLF
jgi:uncharacterized protein with PIN domain